MPGEVRSVRLFVSYSHENAAWCKRLLPVLKVKANVTELQPWHDQELKAGERWDEEIRAELKKMDLFLCLVSYHFLDSRYIADVEMKAALEREKKGDTVIVPLLICEMEERDIAHLKPFNPLPAWGRSWPVLMSHGAMKKNGAGEVRPK